MKALKLTVAALVASATFASVAIARDQIKVTGSSTVFPYSQAAAEEYANKTGKPVRLRTKVGAIQST